MYQRKAAIDRARVRKGHPGAVKKAKTMAKERRARRAQSLAQVQLYHAALERQQTPADQIASPFVDLAQAPEFDFSLHGINFSANDASRFDIEPLFDSTANGELQIGLGEMLASDILNVLQPISLSTPQS